MIEFRWILLFLSLPIKLVSMESGLKLKYAFGVSSDIASEERTLQLVWKLYPENSEIYRIQCALGDPLPPQTVYIWNGTNFFLGSLQGRASSRRNASDFTITIKNPSEKDMGWYACDFNTIHSDDIQGTLYIKAKTAPLQLAYGIDKSFSESDSSVTMIWILYPPDAKLQQISCSALKKQRWEDVVKLTKNKNAIWKQRTSEKYKPILQDSRFDLTIISPSAKDQGAYNCTFISAEADTATSSLVQLSFSNGSQGYSENRALIGLICVATVLLIIAFTFVFHYRKKYIHTQKQMEETENEWRANNDNELRRLGSQKDEEIERLRSQKDTEINKLRDLASQKEIEITHLKAENEKFNEIQNGNAKLVESLRENQKELSKVRGEGEDKELNALQNENDKLLMEKKKELGLKDADEIDSPGITDGASAVQAQIAVSHNEDSWILELDDDMTLSLQYLQSVFPQAAGLTKTIHHDKLGNKKFAVRCVKEKLLPPKGGWGDAEYYIHVSQVAGWLPGGGTQSRPPVTLHGLSERRGAAPFSQTANGTADLSEHRSPSTPTSPTGTPSTPITPPGQQAEDGENSR